MALTLDGTSGITSPDGTVQTTAFRSTQTGSAPMFACRAWCVFDGTLTGTNTPTASGNVTSVVRNSTGNYTINFTTALPDANYCVNATAVTGSSGGQQFVVGVLATNSGTAPTLKTTTQLTVMAHSTSTTFAAQDMKEIYISILR